MKTSLFMLVFFCVSFSLFGWEATHHRNDGYHLMTWEEERAFLAEYPEKYRAYVDEICREYLVPIKYLYRTHYIESKLGKYNIRHENNGTISVGFGQLNSGSIDYFSDRYNNGYVVDPHDPYQNIKISAMYLRDLYERLDGDWITALVAYNWGIGNVHRGNVIPQQTIEYAFSIVWGPWYTPAVEIIKGAVEGMM